MKRSTIATTALALAASVFAGSSFATGVTVTNVFEDFSATLDLANGQTRNNLTWQNSGNDNESAVNTTTQKLDIDTGDGLVTATLTTNDVNVALAANETATFSANVSFYPATDTPDINNKDVDLKFALYAKVEGSATNLMVFASGSEADTGIDIISTAATNVTVNFTSSSTFTVTVGGTTSSSYTFRNGTGINKVEFQGNGSVDDVTLAYTSTLAKDAPIVLDDKPSHELTATEADYLNNLVGTYGKAAVVDTLADVSEETFVKASLLNQDITKDGAGTYTFEITNIKRKNPTTLTVSATLVRGGTSLGANIRGRAYLYTGTTPKAITTKQSEVVFDFNGKTEASADVTIDPTTAPFYKVVIEE